MDEHEDHFRLREIASAEGTTVRELVHEAVDLYARLPAAARRSLRALAALPDDQAVSAMAHAAGHGIVQVGMDLARQRGRRAAARMYPNGQLPSEQAVEREAVRLAREAWTASGPGR